MPRIITCDECKESYWEDRECECDDSKDITIPYSHLKFLPFETELRIDGEEGNYVGTADDKRGSLGYKLCDLMSGDKAPTKRLKKCKIKINKGIYKKAMTRFSKIIKEFPEQ